MQWIREPWISIGSWQNNNSSKKEYKLSKSANINIQIYFFIFLITKKIFKWGNMVSEGSYNRFQLSWDWYSVIIVIPRNSSSCCPYPPLTHRSETRRSRSPLLYPSLHWPTRLKLEEVGAHPSTQFELLGAFSYGWIIIFYASHETENYWENLTTFPGSFSMGGGVDQAEFHIHNSYLWQKQ